MCYWTYYEDEKEKGQEMQKVPSLQKGYCDVVWWQKWCDPLLPGGIPWLLLQ